MNQLEAYLFSPFVRSLIIITPSSLQATMYVSLDGEIRWAPAVIPLLLS